MISPSSRINVSRSSLCRYRASASRDRKLQESTCAADESASAAHAILPAAVSARPTSARVVLNGIVEWNRRMISFDEAEASFEQGTAIEVVAIERVAPASVTKRALRAA